MGETVMAGRRRTRGGVALVATFLVLALAAACTTSGGLSIPKPPQPQYDWVFDADQIEIVDADDFWGDEPYLIHLAFRVQYGVPGSAEVWAVHDLPNVVVCPDPPPFGIQVPGILEHGWCYQGESDPIPDAQGRVFFDDLKATEVQNLLFGQLPEIAGVLTFAFEWEIFNASTWNTSLVEGLITDLLNQIIAAGNLPTDPDAAAPIIVDDTTAFLIDLFGDLAVKVAFGAGLLDEFVGFSPMVIAAVGGVLRELVLAAGWNEIPLLNGYAFTTTEPQTKVVDYHRQELVPGVSLGSNDTTYRLTWNGKHP